ncbi:MAG: hypothetical protein LQ342_004447 [Letrouitia transgressa]|nr:MAG: hypothetical protein LQ342_004447 [Letrouitia transgressa]
MVQYRMAISSQQDDAFDSVLASTITNGRRWLKECMTTHVECRMRNRFVPTRLIDVGPPDGSENPRLLDTGQSGISNDVGLVYATPSHCWGQIEHTATHTDTLGKYRAGIAFSELNRTFQDAVLVTRALGLRYVWIDSLCIIQDSTSDWQRESSLMGSVYGGGAINIVADAAEDGDQGFLSKRIPSCFPYTLPGGKSHGVLHMKASKRERWVKYMGNLRRRAWVLQEYALSACSIRYNTNSIIWECRCGCYFDSEVVCEENQPRRDTRALKNLPLQVNSLSPSVPASKISEVMAVWRNLVIDYSTKELTFERDVLPALSGLASLVHTATGAHYLAGVWKCDLPAALKWVPPFQDRRSTTYVAPTWSWASCKRPWQFSYPLSSTDQFKIKVLDAGITLVEDNPFGRVSDGFIKLEGLIHKGFFKSSNPHSSEMEVTLEQTGGRAGRFIGYVEYDGKIDTLTPVWCLQLCVQSSEDSTMQRDNLHYYGLLILVKDERENVFRRFAYKSCYMTETDWDTAKKRDYNNQVKIHLYF